MGSAESSGDLFADYHVEQTLKHVSILSRAGNSSEKYAMKTYHTSSLDEHTKRVNYFRDYKEKMIDNMELSKLLEVLEERN